MDAHKPSPWWALIGRNWCRNCRRRWPCERWLQARDEFDRAVRQAAANEALKLIVDLDRQVRDAIDSLGRAA